jgi:hypothetical protein
MTRRMIHLAACVLAVLAAVLAWTRSGESTAPTADSRGASPAAAPRLPRHEVAPAAGLPLPQRSPHDPATAEHRAWSDARSDELMTLSWRDDPESLRRILAELENPEPEIRKAALQAVANFGSREAIPYLEAQVSRRDDPQEKIDLIQTAEALKLDSASDYFARKQAATAK